MPHPQRFRLVKALRPPREGGKDAAPSVGVPAREVRAKLVTRLTPAISSQVMPNQPLQGAGWYRPDTGSMAHQFFSLTWLVAGVMVLKKSQRMAPSAVSAGEAVGRLVGGALGRAVGIALGRAVGIAVAHPKVERMIPSVKY